MTEYIEREAALEESVELYYWCGYEDRYGYFVPVDAIQRIPAADVAPVRHGRWLPQVVLGQKAWDCSECKTLGSPCWKWCPVCGAKMDGGNE